MDIRNKIVFFLSPCPETYGPGTTERPSSRNADVVKQACSTQMHVTRSAMEMGWDGEFNAAVEHHGRRRTEVERYIRTKEHASWCTLFKKMRGTSARKLH
jgi:hypothetical protein